MKKNQLWSIISVLCAGLLFASCSKEDKVANRLAGGWEGDWRMSYEDRYGHIYESHYTIIEFHPQDDWDNYGYGYQEDYYDEGPYRKLGFYFRWEVRGRHDNEPIIHIWYPGHSEYDADIYRYTLEKDHFIGYFNNSDIAFDLSKVWKYYQWYDYAGLYADATLTVLYWVDGITTPYYYDTYGYAKKRTAGGSNEADAIYEKYGVKPLSEDANRPVRIFNRFTESTKE